MFAAIDVGNTTTKIAFVAEDETYRVSSFESKRESLPSIVETLTGSSVDKAVICSVKPCFSDMLKETLIKRGIRVFIVDHTVVPLVNRYSPPEDVGTDRLVTAYAVLKRFNSNAVIVDMGTAVTFEVVTRDGEYRGGIIFPGVRLLAESLNEKTALLPLVKLEEEEYPLVADNTVDAVRGGISWGIRILVPGIVRKILRAVGPGFKVFVTGRGMTPFRCFFPKEWTFVPDIIIEGLILLHKELRFE